MTEEYGVDTDSMRWFTQEDGHVAEYVEPPFVTRVPPDKTLPQLLKEGTIDVAIYATDLSKEPELKHVIPNPDAAALAWYEKRKVVPINHMVVTTETFVKQHPDRVREVFDMLLQSKKAAGLPKAGAIDYLPFGVAACRPALETLIRYSARQKMAPRSFTVDELFDDTTRALGA
jgi:4,5-dihydroxyphthalate decarboxylase